MPELRKDPVIGRWVIIATERAERPHDFDLPIVPRTPMSACPFCPDNEGSTPPEVMSYRKDDSKPDSPGWWVRVVPNKYPAVSPEGVMTRTGNGMYDLCGGIGAHEVVIESPDHDATLGSMEPRQIEEILWAYKARFLALSQDKRFRYVMLFRNEGRLAGASLDHPHTQIIALPIVPMRVEEEIDGAKRHFAFKERCVYCDIIRQELRDELRLVEANEHFVACEPFAPRFPFETWIVPRTHRSHFQSIGKEEVVSLAQTLSSTVGKLQRVLNGPPYNLVIHTSPSNVESLPHYHWHIEITPALSPVAGFEWGSGLFINPIPPETAAASLREEAETDEATG